MSLARRNGLGQKLCLVRVCPVIIRSQFLMCVGHWAAVPKSLRLQIHAALRQWLDDPGNAQKMTTLQRLQAEARALVS